MIAIRHAGIVVSDLQRSLHFYRDLLGLELVRMMDESGDYLERLLGLAGVRVTTAKLAASNGNALVELLHFQSHPSRSPQKTIHDIGPSHIAFTVDDLDSIYERLSQAGVRFKAPPQVSPDGLAKVVFCEDPDGTPIELVQPIGA